MITQHSQFVFVHFPTFFSFEHFATFCIHLQAIPRAGRWNNLSGAELCTACASGRASEALGATEDVCEVVRWCGDVW